MALCELLVRLAAVEGRILLLEGPANIDYIDFNIYKYLRMMIMMVAMMVLVYQVSPTRDNWQFNY